MNILYEVFGVPFGFLMKWIYNLVNNYGVAIIIFTFVTKLIFLPVNYKTQKSSARQRSLAPKIEKLKKSFANNPQKFQEEQMKLYQQEGVNPMASCTPMLIQFVLLFGILDVVYRPFTHILHLGKNTIEQARVIASQLAVELGRNEIRTADLRRELMTMEQFKADPSKFSEIGNGFSQKVLEFADNFQIFGVNLGETPSIHPEVWNTNTTGLFLIPILAGVAQLISTIYMQAYNKKKNVVQAPEMNNGCFNTYMYFMPLISVWFAFQVPAGVGFYWIFSSLFSFFITIALNCYFTDARLEKIIAKDRENAKKYAAVNGNKKTLMQRMLEQQAMQNAVDQEKRESVYDENGKKLSRNEINNYHRRMINDARERMAQKYPDTITEAEEKIIAEARRRMAEKYGDKYE